VFQYWHVIAPLLEEAAPRTIVEVGVRYGATTRLLLEYAAAHDAVVRGIDTVPVPAAQELAEQQPERFVFHHGRSLDVLPQLESVDSALVDGDHNWYTVVNELRLLADAAAPGKDFPLTFVHDVGWPYGRRDLYYDPDTVPEDERQPLGRGGLFPRRKDLVEDAGMNRTGWHAVVQGGPRNGVLTAVEDFVAESDIDLRLVLVIGFGGLGILVAERDLASNPGLRDKLAVLDSPDFLRQQCRRLELARNVLRAGRPPRAGRGR
jgi:SAM-dependent methyltransferase